MSWGLNPAIWKVLDQCLVWSKCPKVLVVFIVAFKCKSRGRHMLAHSESHAHRMAVAAPLISAALAQTSDALSVGLGSRDSSWRRRLGQICIQGFSSLQSGHVILQGKSSSARATFWLRPVGLPPAIALQRCILIWALQIPAMKVLLFSFAVREVRLSWAN